MTHKMVRHDGLCKTILRRFQGQIQIRPSRRMVLASRRTVLIRHDASQCVVTDCTKHFVQVSRGYLGHFNYTVRHDGHIVRHDGPCKIYLLSIYHEKRPYESLFTMIIRTTNYQLAKYDGLYRKSHLTRFSFSITSSSCCKEFAKEKGSIIHLSFLSHVSILQF